MNIDIKPNETALKLMSEMTRLMSDLSLNRLLYWERNWKKIKKFLNGQGEVEFLTCIDSNTILIDALPSENTIATFRHSPFGRNQDNTYHLAEAKKSLQKTYGETFATSASRYRLECELEMHEVFRYITEDSADIEEAARCAFTPKQISFLAREQNRFGMKGPLSHTRSNYFVIADSQGIPGILHLWWKGYSHTLSRGLWRFEFSFRFTHDKFRLREGCDLFII